MELVDKLLETIEQGIEEGNEKNLYKEYMLECLIKKLIEKYEQTGIPFNPLRISSPALGDVTLDFTNSQIEINPFHVGKRAYVSPTTTHEITVYLRKGRI